MNTRIIHLPADPGSREALEDVLGEISTALTAGAVAAYPTETYYGLGALSTSAAAVSAVFALKGRDPARPLPLVAGDAAMVRALAASPLPAAFERLAAEFWPGPLTVVLKASAAVPTAVLGPGGTIGVRVPAPGWLRRLVSGLGAPLTATSANLSGGGELSEPGDVLRAFAGKVDLMIDGGPTPGGKPSTVLDLSSGRPRVLRDGAVAAERLKPILADLEI